MRCGRRAVRALAAIVMIVSAVSFALPAAAQDDSLTVVARGLTTPGGFTWNANDVLFIALTGSGGSETVQPEAPAPLGPLTAGETGAVVAIDDGCPTALATGIVSTRTAQGRIFGAESVAELNGQLYVLISNAGDQIGDHERAPGVYRLGGDGSLSLIADHAAFLQDNPPAVAPAEGFPNPGNPVAMASGDGALWIADALNGLITKVEPGEDETLVADLSAQGFAPSDLALGADGSLYASSVGRAPFETGSGSVVNIDAGGAVQIVWSGLTMASGIAIGNDGALYATELATGVSDTAPNGIPGTGRLVRQSGDGLEVVADGLDFPAGLGTGPDGAVYFVTGAMGSAAGAGAMVRYAPDGSAAEAAPADCEPIAETLGGSDDLPAAVQTADETPQATEAAETPAPAETPTPVPTPSPTVPWTPDSAAPTGEVVEVGLSEYVIDMPSKLAAGPVTFLVTNYGALTHSFAIEGPGIDEQLTHELEPGQSGAFTVDLPPGTYSVTSPTPGDRDNGMSLVLTVA
ncbi:MAG TPA: ScyD/ScyE family protein [Thermomicrobiales bacterium]|nr:ScyD/ScyE family protein [Thermomicrobiales bacterium]